jgi:AraC-like DNA-binding protein
MDLLAAPALNLLLRGGAVLVLGLIAATLWRDHPGRTVARLGAAAAIGIAAATLGSAPGFSATPDFWHVLVVGVAAGAMFSFWLFTRAMFDDDFRLRPWHGAAWLLLAAVGAWNCAALAPAHSPLAPAAARWLEAMPVVWAFAAILQSLAHWREDLVDSRRRLRTQVVATIGVYTIGQVLAAWLGDLPVRSVTDSVWNAAGIAALTFVTGWQLLRSAGADLFDAAPSSIAPAAAAEPVRAVADPKHAAALASLMSLDHLYREPSLTIGALAERMALPEHKLRRLINQELGHRNFSAFLNGYRLADTKRWLVDPAQADTPILTLAMDAGFQSLGPFNRAFKATTGVTPTEYRRLNA